MDERFRMLHEVRHAELVAAADRARLVRRCRGHRRPGPVARLYARVWWASRPRASVWSGGLLTAPR
ncbi:MAG: hypothetical protein NTW05_06775 [Pseudonocardiales bacterium]|jgi:hypothetical protein|nr:hypothetical protein [Pseudonocardiales bacterium]